MKQSILVDSYSYSRMFRCVFCLLYLCIFSLTTTINAQIHHRRLWPWPSWPYPGIQPRPWPFEPSPNKPSSPPPIPPKPQPGPAPCPPIPPKPQPKPAPAPGPSPIPPKPQPAPGPSPLPPKPPVPTPKPGPPQPGPKPFAPPGPAPKPIPPKPPVPNPKPIPPKPPVPNPKPIPPKPPGPHPTPNPTPPKPQIPAVFFFGDSIFDTGNNNNRSTKVKSNYRPYGMDFKFGVATGRFGNGKVAADYISEYFGVKEIVPAYLDPKLVKSLLEENSSERSELLTGVSFASGGGGYDPPTSEATRAIPMLDQLTYFQDYKEKLKKLVGKEKRDVILSKGVAIVVAGGNDLINTYFGSGAQRLKNDIDSFTTIMADSAASFVLQLNGYGAKRIGVIGTPPLGCAPAQRSRKQKKCNEDMNYAAQLFNSKLFIILGQMSKTLPDSKLVYMDIYSIFSEMLENPAEYGFDNVKSSCCKTGLTGGGVLCSRSTTKICPNTSSYLFWDGFHPTQRASQLLNKVLVKEYLHVLSH